MELFDAILSMARGEVMFNVTSNSECRGIRANPANSVLGISCLLYPLYSVDISVFLTATRHVFVNFISILTLPEE